MNLFGVPIFVTTDMIAMFLTTHFSDVVLTSNEMFYTFLAVNFIYLWFMCRVIVPFLYKCLMFVLNHVF